MVALRLVITSSYNATLNVLLDRAAVKLRATCNLFAGAVAAMLRTLPKPGNIDFCKLEINSAL